jgi:hypothetical protein
MTALVALMLLMRPECRVALIEFDSVATRAVERLHLSSQVDQSVLRHKVSQLSLIEFNAVDSYFVECAVELGVISRSLPTMHVNSLFLAAL